MIQFIPHPFNNAFPKATFLIKAVIYYSTPDKVFYLSMWLAKKKVQHQSIKFYAAFLQENTVRNVKNHAIAQMK